MIEDLKKQLDQADIERVGQYMKMFDRILLYTIAVNSIPKQAIEQTLDLWEKVVIKGIDMDATNRTEFLESTPAGRMAKYANEPDGEDLRLHLLKQKNVAKQVIQSNLQQGMDDLNQINGPG